MCGRYTQTKRQRDLEAHFGIDVQEVLPRFNVAPTQKALVLHTESHRAITEMRWGFVPTWSTMDGGSQLLINAKGETIAEKRTFKNAFQSNRCLVVADSFFEWRHEGGLKQPVRFVLKSGEPFCFAGIWQENNADRAFVIITTEPNDLVRPVHNRMPVILDREDYAEWLSPDTPFERLAGLLKPFPVQRMTAYDVDPIVGSAKVDSPQCIGPYRPAQGLLF